jgi:uncharacterized protein YjbJ (UPF0337 family)
MDPDRVKGKGRGVKGDIKKAAGDLTGDKSMKAEGVIDKVAGKAQQAWGRMKDEVRSEDRRRDEQRPL